MEFKEYVFYKTAFDGNFFEVRFLSDKFVTEDAATNRESARGVEPTKKQEIIQKLFPMPINRRKF